MGLQDRYGNELATQSIAARDAYLVHPAHQAFVAAIGACTPAMIELAPPLTRQLAALAGRYIDFPE